ncbi:sensor histidine kinase [soil metagenome]|jgi:two-component system sensor histidine kinase DesK
MATSRPLARRFTLRRLASPWPKGWMRLVFPAVFLIYLVQTVAGVLSYTDGLLTWLGMTILALFAVCYIGCTASGTGGRYREFWRWYAALVVLFLLELPLAHQDALPMLTYIGVMSVASLYQRAIPLIVGLIAVALFLPVLIPSWHAGLQPGTAISVGIVALAMFAFFGIVRTNEALQDARAEVARLAAEGERTRIARDLHDLLGHSLTTITVKASLAHRLSELDPARAAAEIAEVEALARATLTDVRAAVAGYREVTLGNELAAAREVLRAAGITAQIPSAIDSVPSTDSELFAWVVREGVTNVVRHSRASTCEIRLAERSIEILDDGIGRAAGSSVRTPGQGGSGLLGLGERVAAADGQLVAGAREQQPGWRILVELGTR